MKRIIEIFAILVICLFVLSLFGWLSVHVSKGDKDFGFLNTPIEFMYSFLDQFEESVEEVQEISPTFIKTPDDFDSINKLKDDILVLTSHSASDYKRHVTIRNLKNDSTVFTWKLKDVFNKNDRLLHSMHFPNNDLIYGVYMRTGLKRVNAEIEEIWTQDSIVVHHSITRDADGMIWACTGNPPAWSASGKFNIFGRTVYFMDDYLTQINPENGRILYHKSVSEIFEENDLTSYLLHSQSGQDPLHLNDIQPALKTTDWYDKGDLFISLKQISLIFQYRPSTGKVIRSIKGPFSAQHDVDFRNDSTLTWFNNNYYALWTEDSKPEPKNHESIKQYADLFSNIVAYDLSSEKFSFIGDSIFRANWIYTGNEGLHEFINDSTYFVEQQNQGILWVIQNDEVIYKDVFRSSEKNGYHHLPNWHRIIK
jgi:hypothetical protein